MERKDMNQITYIGRFDYSSPEGPIFAWSGSTIKARFQGTSLSAYIKPIHPQQSKNWMNVTIDGKIQKPIQIDKDAVYLLAEGLEEGVHEVVLTKRTEALVGELQFMGFQVKDGQLVDPPAVSERRLEFIGDSITCGYGNEASCIEDGFQESQENNDIAYGAITARRLGADHITAAWSGKGVYRNYSGDTVDTMSVLYDRTLPSRKDSHWDFKGWDPQAVIINLGTNDFAQVPVDHQAYQEAYTNLVKRVRGHYPDAHIFCTVGSIRVDLGVDVQQVVESFHKDGEATVHYVEFPLQNVEKDGIGGDWHPSAQMHRLMAQQLTKEIEDKLNW